MIKIQEKETINKTFSDIKTETLLSSNDESVIENDINKNCEMTNKIQNDDLEKIKLGGKDTLDILNILATRNKFLSERFEKKFKKINSLIDLNLPYTKNYELFLNYSRLKEKEKFNKKFNSISPDFKSKYKT